MTLDAVRVNDRAFSWGSCSFSIDDQPISEMLAVAYEESLRPRIIPSTRPNEKPLGMSTGKYEARLSFAMLKETAASFVAYLTQRAGGYGYGQTLFDFKLQAVEPGLDVFTLGSPYTRIAGKRDRFVEGVDELVTEFDLATLYLSENGKRLWLDPSDPASDLAVFAPHYVTIGGEQSPGKCTVRNFAVKQRWDERAAYGLSFGSLWPTGAVLAHADLFFELWEPGHITAWTTYAKKYFAPGKPVAPKGSKTAYAITIGHPVLSAAPMRTAKYVVEECGQLELSEDGVYTATVKLIQYGEPIVAPDKPTEVYSDTQATQPSAQDAADQVISQMTTQVAALAGGG